MCNWNPIIIHIKVSISISAVLNHGFIRSFLLCNISFLFRILLCTLLGNRTYLGNLRIKFPIDLGRILPCTFVVCVILVPFDFSYKICCSFPDSSEEFFRIFLVVKVLFVSDESLFPLHDIVLWWYVCENIMLNYSVLIDPIVARFPRHICNSYSSSKLTVITPYY